MQVQYFGTIPAKNGTHLTKEDIVGLILGGHKHYEDPIEELEPFKGRDTHVEEDTEQHGHGDQPQDWHHQHGHADAHEDQHVRNTVLPDRRWI